MKMLIADDDISLIEMIEQVHDWSALGIDTLLRAYNGAVARQLIESERPDIVLCDISMPQSSGMDVLRWVYENKIDTEFILLTAYASFEYARDAVRYGASNYVTKPFAPADLLSAVQAAIGRLEARRSDHHTHRRFVANLFFSGLYRGTFGTDRERISKRLLDWDCGIQIDCCFRVVYATVDCASVREYGSWREESFQYAFRHIALEAVADRLLFEMALDGWEDTRYTVRMFLPEEQFDEETLAARCGRFVEACRKYLHVQPLCLLGEVIPLEQVYPYCEEMDRILRKFRFLKGRTLLYSQWDSLEDGPACPVDRERIQNCLRQRNKAALVEYVGELVNEAMRSGSQGDSLFHQLHQDLLQIFYGHLQEHGVEAHVLFQDKVARELSERAEQSALDMMRFAAAMYDGVIAAEESIAAPSGIIASVKQYIDGHYRENINREEIAAFVYITPNYLSKLFRNETGTTLREYINSRRIKEAKRLLATTDLSVSEIALETGFENMSYFSTVFKKSCGVSPLVWRNGG